MIKLKWEMNMEKYINPGDRVKISENTPEDIRGKTGRITRFLEIVRVNLPSNYGLYIDVNMWEVELDESKELKPVPEDWLEKIA